MQHCLYFLHKSRCTALYYEDSTFPDMNCSRFFAGAGLVLLTLWAPAAPAQRSSYKLPDGLVRYASQRGVRPEATGTDSLRLTRLLFTLAYGTKDRTYFDYADRLRVPEQPDTASIRAATAAIARGSNWEPVVSKLEPRFPEYQQLVKANMQAGLSAQNRKWLAISLNGYRILNRYMPFDRMLLINIPQAVLTVIDNGSAAKLRMNVKVGTSRTPTPRFYTLVRQVNLYPYWTAPKPEIEGYLPKIHTNTLPPAFYVVRKKDSLRMDGNDRKLRRISARKFNKKYWLKKGPGTDNPLGVVRINFQESFEDIYLHDTNERTAFCQTPSALSHGCIRLQKPLSLANLLLESRKDWTPVRYQDQVCYQEPSGNPVVENRPVLVQGTIPVFIVYFPAFYDPQAGKVAYRDVYKKFP